ncbi:MAG: hypothetical protein IPN95_21840 [Bacteroidetes bacterium]|nr:hypothetical protein [Bacteroidota bacterium]
MRTGKMFLALMMVCLFAAKVNAQEVSFSDVDIVNNGDGTATVAMQISGNMSGTVGDVTFSVSGDAVKEGSYFDFINPSNLLMPNPLIIVDFPINETSNNSEEEWVDVEITYALVTGGPKKLIKKARMPKDVNKVM